ncbi:unnamed protein product, partial [Allacma fusca]
MSLISIGEIFFLESQLSTRRNSLNLKIMRQLVLPAGHASIEEDVSNCDNVAYIDFQSTILNFRVPMYRRGTVLTKPFLMGKESIFQGLYGWAT